AQPKAVQQRCPPVWDVSGVERRLEELVLQEHPGAVRERRVDLTEGLFDPLLAAAEIILPGIVRPVGEPQRQDRGSGLAHDVDAAKQLAYCLAANLGLRARDAAQPEVLDLKRVRADGADPQA